MCLFVCLYVCLSVWLRAQLVTHRAWKDSNHAACSSLHKQALSSCSQCVAAEEKQQAWRCGSSNSKQKQVHAFSMQTVSPISSVRGSQVKVGEAREHESAVDVEVRLLVVAADQRAQDTTRAP
jgi:hypothetical protein